MDLEQSKAAFFRQKRKIYYASFLLISILVSIFWFWRVYFYPYETTEDASFQGVDISISPIVTGQIVHMKVEEGSVVKKGDLLFVVDDTLLKFQRDKAIAGILHAQEEAKVQQIQLGFAQEEFERAKTEYDASVISKEMFNQAETNLKLAEATLGSIFSLVEVEEANLKIVERQIELSQVRAPSEGVIAKVWRFAGDVVQAGQTTLTLIDLVNVWVDAKIEETKISSIHVGDSVILTVDAYPDLTLKGVVTVVGAAAASQFALIPANNSSGNFTKVTQRLPLRIAFTVPDDESMLYLRPGMSVKAKIRAR